MTVHPQAGRSGRVPRAILLLIFLSAIFLPAGQGFGQSGRTTPSEKSDKRPVAKPKPVPPPPLQGGVPDSSQKADPNSGDGVLRINSDLVTVIATIASPAGVAGTLERDDFEILEDGVKQELSDFVRDAEMPLQMVMLFDTSLSVAPRIGFERRAAAKFFERVMRPQDQSALYSVATDVTVLQDFTSKVSQLTKTVKLLRAEGATALYDGIYLAAAQLKGRKGRHIIVLVSDGGNTVGAKDLKEAVTAAQQSDAVIYAVFTGNLSTSLNVQDLAAERALATLTTETGGEVFRPRISPDATDEQIDNNSIKDLDKVFERLADQLRTQYTLGFYSTNEGRDGKFRKLSVKVRKPGYAVKTRSGYYAPKG
jgi:Ca-activated chloride channel homolog